MVRRISFLVCLSIAPLALAAPADVEIFGGLGFSWPALDSTFDASYVPSEVGSSNDLFVTPDPRSQARQLLALQGKMGLELGLGLNVYPHRVVGFQFLLDRFETDIAGENQPQQVHLVWDSIAFPSPDPVVREADIEIPSGDTEGRLSELALSFNLTARFGAGGPVSGSVSSGLTYFRFDASAQPLAAMAGYLGGHAVLFAETYEMAYATSTESAFGINAGGSVDLALGAHAAIFADGRFFWAPRTEAEVTLTEVVSDPLLTVPVSQIDEFLDLPPLEIDPGFLRLLFGLKLRF
jgi:hypothetical protein